MADAIAVDTGFVRILLVSPGSVVVCWAVAVPQDSLLTNQELSVLLSENLDASIVSGSSLPLSICTAVLGIQIDDKCIDAHVFDINTNFNTAY